MVQYRHLQTNQCSFFRYLKPQHRSDSECGSTEERIFSMKRTDRGCRVDSMQAADLFASQVAETRFDGTKDMMRPAETEKQSRLTQLLKTACCETPAVEEKCFPNPETRRSSACAPNTGHFPSFGEENAIQPGLCGLKAVHNTFRRKISSWRSVAAN